MSETSQPNERSDQAVEADAQLIALEREDWIASYPDTAKEKRWSPRMRLFLIVGANALPWLVILVLFFLSV